MVEGVFAERPDGSPRFGAAPAPPSDVEVARLLTAVRRRIIRLPDPSIAHVRAGGHVHLYLEVGGVAAAAAELKRKGIALRRDVHETPWATREILLEDDQGHTVYLFENR